MQVLGIALIVVGFLFIVLAMVAAARKIFQKAQAPAGQALGAFDPGAWAKLITAIVNFIKVAPEWLLLAVVGAGLIAWGAATL
ncbi:MAG: hypothetical protein QOJ57_342 [Thermoleophilaceae bacterium]|nr:hypothetical protein [Thermoleophilaceae bacterium]